jgi:hypothetical protein
MLQKLLKAFLNVSKVLDSPAQSSRLVLPDGRLQKVNGMYTLNQWVRVKEYEICVMAVSDERVPPFRFRFEAASYQPPSLVGEEAVPQPADSSEERVRVLFVDVMYRNPTSDKSLDCRRNQWVLYDTNGYNYEPTESNRFLYENNNKPFMGGSRFINPGMKLRGWLAFEIGEDVVPEHLQFTDGFLRGNTAEFRL